MAPPLEDEDLTDRQRWRRVQALISEVWRRFLKEMIPELRGRQKWRDDKPNVKVDDVFLEIDENLPRGAWRLVRISEIIPSEDGRVRRVKVVNSAQKSMSVPLLDFVQSTNQQSSRRNSSSHYTQSLCL